MNDKEKLEIAINALKALQSGANMFGAMPGFAKTVLRLCDEALKDLGET